jgi:hypothetical protein
MSSETDEKSKEQRGPLGDARPDHDAPDPRTRGGQPQEKVEDRPNVSTVTPEDYPKGQRAGGETGRS